MGFGTTFKEYGTRKNIDNSWDGLKYSPPKVRKYLKKITSGKRRRFQKSLLKEI